MKKVYILYGRISTSTDPNGKVAAFQKMLGIFGSKETAKRYEDVVDPLQDVNIDNLEYVVEEYPVIGDVVEEYPVIGDEEIDNLQSTN